jgi:uncharacterized protein
MPTWSEIKRQSNITDHQLDFLGCENIFDHPVLVFEDKRQAYGEQRFCALGWLHGCVVHLTYTERELDFHVISLRKAEKHEIKHYIKEISR